MLATGALTAGNTVPQTSDVRVTVSALRSARGQVLACLTARPETFPDCSRDPSARKYVVAARQDDVHFTFRNVPYGDYAISILHDENGNGKADRLMLIPREGFGFSRDAKVRLGPPDFSAAAFPVEDPIVHQAITMRYIF